MWRLRANGPPVVQCWLQTLRHVLNEAATCNLAAAGYAAHATASEAQHISQEQLDAAGTALQQQQYPGLLALQQTMQHSSFTYTTVCLLQQHMSAVTRHPGTRPLPLSPYMQSSRGYTSRGHASKRSTQARHAVYEDRKYHAGDDTHISQQPYQVAVQRKGRSKVQQPGMHLQQQHQQPRQGYKQQQQQQQQQGWYDAESLASTTVPFERSSQWVRSRQQQQQQQWHQQRHKPQRQQKQHHSSGLPSTAGPNARSKSQWQAHVWYNQGEFRHQEATQGFNRLQHQQQQQQQEAPEVARLFRRANRQQQRRQEGHMPDQQGGDCGLAAFAGASSTSRGSSTVDPAAAAAAALGKHNASSPAAAAATASTLEPAALTAALGKSKTLADLQKILSQHNDQLQQINICAAFKAVVRLSQPISSSSGSSSSKKSDAAALAIMRQLSSKMQVQIRTARPWDLAQAAWACSKLQYRDQAFLNAVAQHTIRKAPILLPQDIAQIASAFARLNLKNRPLLQLLQQQTLVKADSFEPWSLIHTAWSLEILGAPSGYMTELLTVICKQFEFKQVQKLQSLDVATILWLMASHEFYNQQLLESIGQLLTAQIARYPPATAAQALISIAGLGFYDCDLAMAAAATVQQQMEQQQYSPKQLAQVTFAVVKLDHASPELLDAAAAAFVSSSSGSYSPRFLCMICWAMILGGYRSEKFTEKLVQECRDQLPHFTADQIASIVRGLFRSPGWSDHTQITDLISAAADQLPQQLPDMQTAVLGKLIVSLCKQQQYSETRYTQQQQQQMQVASDSSQQQQQQKGELLVLLQHCAEEWQQRQQQQEINAKQLEDVQSALAAAGLVDQAAAAAAASLQGGTELTSEPDHLQPSHSHEQPAQQQQQQEAAVIKQQELLQHKEIAGDAQPGSWLDSFVAAADDK